MPTDEHFDTNKIANGRRVFNSRVATLVVQPTAAASRRQEKRARARRVSTDVASRKSISNTRSSCRCRHCRCRHCRCRRCRRCCRAVERVGRRRHHENARATFRRLSTYTQAFGCRRHRRRHGGRQQCQRDAMRRDETRTRSLCSLERRLTSATAAATSTDRATMTATLVYVRARALPTRAREREGGQRKNGCEK